MNFHIERNYTFTNETKMNMSDKNKRTSDKKEISHSLGNDFKIFRNSTKFSIPLYPSYSRRAVVAFCTGGRAKVDVHGYEHLFTKGELVVIFPGQLVSLSEISQDFTVSYFSLSLSLYNDVLSGLHRFSPHFFFYMRSHYHYKLSDLETSKYINFFQLIYSKVNAPENLYRKDSVILLMRIFYLDLYNIYKVNSHTGKQTFDNHKKELAHGFFLLIMKFYKENRSVAFYADKLHITPKYLHDGSQGSERNVGQGLDNRIYPAGDQVPVKKLISEHPGDRYPDTFLQPDITWEVFQTTYGIVSFGLQKAELITSK